MKNRKASAVCPSHPEIPKRWRDLLALIPGYDSIATAPPGYWFDVKTADLCVWFFHTHLKHTEGKNFRGNPLKLEPWQQAKLGAAFGWKRPDGLRRYREVLDYEPRKNGKTTFAAGLVNLVGFLDREPGAQIYSIASTREQASIVFRHTRGQILQNPDLLGELPNGTKSIHRTYRSIEYQDEGIFKSLPSDADAQHGLNPSFVVGDELHAHENGDMLEVMETAVGSREQPMIWNITTADYDRPSACNRKHKYACDVRDGVFKDPEFLPIIYETGRDEDWTSPAVWAKANPNLGVSVRLDHLARECEKAKNDPTKQNGFCRLHLNMKTEQAERLITLAKWDAGQREIRIEDYAGRTCYGGLDLGATSDFSAFVLAFPEANGEFAVFEWFWFPEQPRVREARMQEQITTWGNQKFFEITPGNVVDISHIVNQVVGICAPYDVREIASDPFMAVHAMQLLGNEGFQVIEFRQGFTSMALPTKTTLELIASGRLLHREHPVMRWMIGNAAAEYDSAQNCKISKKKSTEKIDGVIAMVMAIGRATINEMGGEGSYASVDDFMTVQKK